MSEKICQIIDSSGNLPRDLLERFEIKEVPFYFRFNNPHDYRENVDYHITEFYDHMEKYPDEIPKTSAPNINDWLTVFEERYNRGFRKYIVTTISSKLSGSYQAAVSAKNLFTEKHGDVEMKVVSSNTCACGQAALEIGIAQLIESGEEYQKIAEAIEKMVRKVNTLFVVDSLKYMKAGGRIGGATAFVGKLIHIKPVCEFEEGAVKPVKAAIGRKNSLKTMVDVAVSRMPNIKKLIVIVQNAKYRQDKEYIVKYLREKTQYTGPLYESHLGIIVGAHSGPGAMGIGFVENPLIK